MLAPRGVHDCIWNFARRPPRVNSGDRIEITSFISRDRSMFQIPIQAGVPIFAHLTVTPFANAPGQHAVLVRWENRLPQAYTVLFERFRRDNPPNGDSQPDNIDEAVVPAMEPNPVGETYGTVDQTQCADTNIYRYVS